MNNQNHPFHLVSSSPWPLLISISLLNNLISTAMWFHSLTPFHALFFSLLCSLMCICLWWRDIIREATFIGSHTNNVHNGIRLGMILFIISEIFFFISFFWAFFHSSLSPDIEMGQLWPPMNISPFNPFDIPLLNSIILVSSGLSITWSHHSLLNHNNNETYHSLLLTIFLGIYFSCLQLTEYIEAPFTIADSIYGSTFFITTGFHGLHVFIGSFFLMVSFMRLSLNHFSNNHHFGFEAATWYWHFVDVIWLFLFISIYWWTF